MKFKNVGPINKGEITLSDMTIFFGKNGVGKTYASYVLFGILTFLLETTPDFIKDTHIKDLVKNKEIIMNFDSTLTVVRKELIDSVKLEMPDILSSSFNRNKNSSIGEMEVLFTEEDFINMNYFINRTELASQDMSNIFESRFSLKLIGIEGFSEDKLYNIIFDYDSESDNIIIKLSENNYKTNVSASEKKEFDPIVLPGIDRLRGYLNGIVARQLKIPARAVYIPAERIGINVFRNEIKNNRLNIYDQIAEKAKISHVLDQSKIDLYPSPISSYISNLNNWGEFYEFFKNPNFVDSSESLKYAKNILETDLLKGQFYIDSDNDEIKYISKDYDTEIPLQVASSSIKSLLGLELYLQTFAKVGDYLIIDEPELNLHPESQKHLAILLNELVSKGLKIIISTHSDYLIRELINLELKKNIKNKQNKEGEEKLKSTIAYDFVDNTIKEISNIHNQSVIHNFDDLTLEIEDEYYDLLAEYQDLLEGE
ncbi:AAA family ATPase [Lactococcus formosensis subsp. bovis]|uniref:AAA family ATPase n=1 Tax=Lactococcus formosensis TaxID=1281486 RepID=UPI001BCDFA47|nr:AAA family ATPase [Lactococcus formosensis]